nr:uncharacterized protein LOC111427990 [Onthophagus taurus]
MQCDEQSSTDFVSTDINQHLTSIEETNFNNKICLTQLWEYVIKHKKLPENLDASIFFNLVTQKLRNPEWEVRQHSLRVLIDIIPVIKIEELDANIDETLNEIVRNLGHIGPAVRKAAIDALKTYVNHTSKPTLIIRELIHKGIEKSVINKVNPNITLGIIIAVPFLITNKISIEALRYLIHVLLEKLENILHQETIIRSLVRIKSVIGNKKFNEILDAHKSKKDFEMLCELYNFPEPTVCDFIPDIYENKQIWSDHNQNFLSEEIEDNKKVDKVILETEIKLDEGQAITMKIHEESKNNNYFDSSDNSDSENRGIGTFQVLADDSDDDYESWRKTPRRVRFGGEIVKMRTPDSDSNQQSDEVDEKSSKSKPLLEIHYKSSTKLLNKSHIPVLISSKSRPNSEPNSPKRIPSKKLHKSSPNLSRIPKNKNYNQKQITKTIKIKVNQPNTKNTRREEHPRKLVRGKTIGSKIIEVKEENEKKFKPNKEKLDENIRNLSPPKASLSSRTSSPRSLSPPKKTTKNMDRYSPIPVHNEIEVFHNLTRKLKEKERHLTTADDVLLEKTPSLHERKIRTADDATEDKSFFVNYYNSFHVCNNVSNESNTLDFDSSIATRESGDLTCSSSGSEGEKIICERIGLIDERIMHDIQLRNDVIAKKNGLEELLKVLKDKTVLDSISDKLPSLLNILFNAEQQPILQSISEQILTYIFGNITEEAILNKIQPIIYNLSRTGSPLGVRLALIILNRLPSKFLIDSLLEDSILTAKSSKVREGALQILMAITRIFPSTEINIPNCLSSVLKLLKDKKRKVRQAALETTAALSQLSSTIMVLDIATTIFQNYPDNDQLLRVIRTRLSRKQLPAIDLDGNIRYSTPLGQTELNFLSNINGSLEQRKALQAVESFPESYQESFSERKSESSNEEKANYWIHKKHHIDFNERGIDDIDWNSHEYRDESHKNLQPQIWAIDPGNLYVNPEKVNQVNGSLRPVFVVQPESSQSYESSLNGISKSNKETNTEHDVNIRHNRGRSFSPPKKGYDSSLENSFENDRFYKNDGSKNTRIFNNEKFHKSLSSDQLLLNDRRYSRHSESSSTSGSSMRSNYAWKRDVLSGIPVPINTDCRFKIRTRQNESKGPLVTSQYYNSKLQSTDTISDKLSNNIPTRPVIAKKPFSSGSESSGYFTPPTEPLLPDIFDHHHAGDAPRSKSSQSERFIRIGTPSIHHENFTVIDSNYCESLKTKSAPVQHYPSFDSVDFETSKEFGEIVERVSSPEEESQKDEKDIIVSDEDDLESQVLENVLKDDLEVEVVEKYEQKILRRESTVNSLEDLDFIANQAFGERKLLSKSEADILTSTEIARKTINSAPTINKTYEHFKTFDDTPISSTKTSLPGSVVDFQEIEVVQEVIQEKTPTKMVCTKRKLSRKRSIKTFKTPPEEKKTIFDPSTPFTKPKESLMETLNQLDSSEWEITMKGLQNLIKLVRHHQTTVESNLHQICVGLSKHIKNLRSQVARNACTAASELFRTCKKHMEVEIEELAIPLLHRTADTNKFLRSDANTALDDMSANLSPPKVVAVVTSKGSTHQNAIVRCASIRILCALCHRLGPEKFFQLPKDTRDKILLTGANMLTEGSLETRKHAKMMLGLLSRHIQFHKAMVEAVPSHIMRHISKSLKTLI